MNAKRPCPFCSGEHDDPRDDGCCFCDHTGFIYDDIPELIQIKDDENIEKLSDYNRYELNFCEKCYQMTNHLDGICQKCKGV